LGRTYGRVAIDSEESEICSRCRSRRDIMENSVVVLSNSGMIVHVYQSRVVIRDFTRLREARGPAGKGCGRGSSPFSHKYLV
jgi:hypothetical protein